MISQNLRLWGRIASVVTVFLLPQTISAETLRIGDIGKQPTAQIKTFAPFAGYLAKELASEGITEGKVIVVKSIPEMAKSIREKKVDLYIDSSYPVLAVKRLSDIKFLLRRWKKGQGDYYGVIFVRKDSGIGQLEDLKGKMFAFEESFSTVPYFVPKMILVEKGLRVVQKKGTSDSVLPDEVGYIFVGDDPNTMFWVLRARAAVGVMNNQNYLNYGKGHLGSLKIIHETFSLPRQVVTYRADLNPKLVARIREILVKMDQSAEGRKVLKDFEGTTKFDEIADEAMLSLSKLQKFIDTELGMK